MEKILHLNTPRLHLNLYFSLFLYALITFYCAICTGLSTVSSVIVAISIVLIASLINTALSNKETRHIIARVIAGFLLYTLFAFEVKGKEHLKIQGKAILAGNHTSLIDSLIVSVACNRPINFLMAQVVLSWPFAGKLVRLFNVIPVVPGKGTNALNQAVELLNNGKFVCIFPEGICTTDGNLNKFHKGAAYLQDKSNAPVVPFAIKGGFEAWPIGAKLPRFCKITIEFGQPIINTDKLSSKELTEELKSRVQSMKNVL